MGSAAKSNGPYRFTVAWIAGLTTTLVHIGTAGYLWFSFRHHPSVTSEVNAPEVTLPLTVAYFLSIAKWFVDTKGLRRSDARYGWPMVAFLIIVVSAFLIALPLGPYLYIQGDLIRDAKTLNEFYLFVETVLGGAFALIFGELFGNANAENDDRPPAAAPPAATPPAPDK